MTAARGPVPLAVSTSLDSCGVLEDQIICKLDVSYNALSNATAYSATVTRADGSVVDYGGVAPGGTSLWVPYVGAGSYSVRITAYGEPERPEGDKPVISTEVSRAKAEVEDAESETEVEARGATSQTQADARGEVGQVGAATGEATAGVEATPTCAETPAPPEPIAPAPLPEEPPQDLDPANPDEDGDGIADEQERLDYETAVAEQQAAEAVAEVPEAIDC